jgi:endonuclease III
MEFFMNIKTVFVALLLLNFVTACSEVNPHPMDMTQLVQNAKTHEDHEALAKHYDDAAQEAQAKLVEHEKLLEKYQTGSYGRQAQPLKNHCEFLVRTYKQAVESNKAMADVHRKMATEAK